MSAHPSITCPKCRKTSYNANDIAQGYCGHCHDWTSNPDRTTPSACPTCHEPFDSATLVGETSGEKPGPDDFSVCTNCGEINVFKADLTVRPAHLNDFMELDKRTHDLLRAAQLAIRKLRPTKGA